MYAIPRAHTASLQSTGGDMSIDLDEIVRNVIERCFPNGPVPDLNNYLSNGNQFKAPDHSLFDGKVLVERKSRRNTSSNNVYLKIQSIAGAQGKPVFAVGKVSLGRILENLPDQQQASRQIVDYLYGQMLKSLKDARDKFAQYEANSPSGERLRVVIFSDMSDSVHSTDTIEYFIGRKMGAVSPVDDVLQEIDVVIYLMCPQNLIDGPNSYWLKCLYREKLGPDANRFISQFLYVFHLAVWEELEKLGQTKHNRYAELQMTGV